MKTSYTKRDAIRIVTSAAKDYQKNLEGINLLFIYRDKSSNKIEFFETVFQANNFQHLTGIEMVDSSGTVVRNAKSFYQKCLDGKLKEEEIQFKKDGTTEFKLNAISPVVNFIDKAKMTGLFNGNGLKLAVDRVVGTITYCLGFIKRDKDDYYCPSSCLLEDTRKVVDAASQILAIMSKSAENKEKLYSEIRYLAKGFPIEKVDLPENLSCKISLEKK